MNNEKDSKKTSEEALIVAIELRHDFENALMERLKRVYPENVVDVEATQIHIEGYVSMGGQKHPFRVGVWDVMDEEVEKWIEELLKNGTFESREDIFEFCVYAVKTYSEVTKLNQKTIIEGKKESEKRGEPVPNPLFPIKLKNWKAFLEEEKEAIQDIGSMAEKARKKEYLRIIKEVNEGKYDKDAPKSGITGELAGSSDKGEGI